MTPLRIGHRGAAGHAPENTLLSIETAISLGVDAVEIDVQQTADGHLVVIHDWDVSRTTDGTGRVRDLTLDVIRSFRTRKQAQVVPTLSEVLECVAGRTDLMIEIKVADIAEAIVAEVAMAAFPGVVYFASFLHSELLRVRDLRPDARTVALLDAVPVYRTAFATDARATHAGIAINSLSPEFVRALHAGGMGVFTYTADSTEQVAYAHSCCVDGIISNFPARLNIAGLQ
jgi:glycerophosphoryl diester phosphodiesterase